MAALHKSAQAGDAEAQYALGNAYLGWEAFDQVKGIESGKKAHGSPKIEFTRQTSSGLVDTDAIQPIDELKAAQWLESAALQGHVGAQRKLGQLYLPNPFDKFDPDTFLAQTAGAAVNGPQSSPLPPNIVPDRVPVQKVKKDAKRAIAWFTKAANGGDAESQLQLGIAYGSGNGVTANRDESMAWYRKAAEQGNRYAQFNLAEQLLDTSVRKLAEERKVDFDAARASGYSLEVILASIANRKTNSNSQIPPFDPSQDKEAQEALRWLEKAGAQGLLPASAVLGMMYYNGIGATADLSQFHAWTQKAAEGGWHLAQARLAWAYTSGTGVGRNHQQAAAWWRKAADQGNSEAQRNLGFLYRDGEGVPKDSTKAFDLFLKAATSGDATAQAAVGGLLFFGQGTTKDVVLGYAWTNLAAAAGVEWALQNRLPMEESMESDAVKEAQRISSSWTVGTPLERVGSATDVQPTASGTLSKTGSGTIFIVSQEGHAVTNHHVVKDCKELRLQGDDSASKLITADAVNDLALLTVAVSSARAATLSAASTSLRQGDEIVVFGFPLNAVLSSGGNLTPGVVSALTGLGNNTNQIQITAAIQPGSSGSPVMNRKGEVVAVVSQKLSDGAMAKATGAIGQNVNFAVNGQTLRSFLDANQVRYRKGAGLFSGEKSIADLADAARQWTRVVECWK